MSRRLVFAVLVFAVLAPGCIAVSKEVSAPPASRPDAARRVVSSPRAPSPVGPYSQAVQVGPVLYLAGQIGMDPATGALLGGGIEAETRQALANLGAVLEAAGYSFADVVQVQVFLTDLGDFEAFNGVYGQTFRKDPPARATVQVEALPRGARVEIAMVAARAPR